MKKMKKAALAVLTSMALVLSLGAVAGCSSPADDEKVIRETLTEELEQLKNADEEAVEALVSAIEDGVSASDLAQLESMGLTSQSIVDSMLEGFDYTINDITVDGNDATAAVTLTTKNFDQFTTDVAEVVSGMLENPSQYASMSEDEIMSLVGEKVQEALTNLPLTTNDVALTYEKINNVWEPTDQAVEDLSSVFFQ